MGCEEKDAKELKDATLIRRTTRQRSVEKSQDDDRPKSNAALAPCYNQCLIHDYRLCYTVETVFFDFGCSLAIKWESEWAKSNIYSILKICMTNSLWLVSQLKHVLWELFLGLPSVISVLYLRSGLFKGPLLGPPLAQTKHSLHAYLPASPRWDMGQGICKCVEDEGSTSASLDVTSVASTARKGSIPKSPPKHGRGMMHPKCHVWCIYITNIYL